MKGHPTISGIYRQGPEDRDPCPKEERYHDVQHQAARKEIALIRLDDPRLGEYDGRLLRRIVEDLTGVQV
ncbi:MAG: hypothetical protein AAFO01_11725 [Pseudomonadota bacterium]